VNTPVLGVALPTGVAFKLGIVNEVADNVVNEPVLGVTLPIGVAFKLGTLID
jgi:hypothetical protein